MAKPDTAPIEIFRAGTHRASGGERLTFSEVDLADAAGAYDPTKHEAPLVVGHPASDKPAFGWISKLTAEGGSLFAQPDLVDAAFAELVRAGRFKKISASFYQPDAEANPVPGTWYLRHVGFLGAQAPSVKGLRQVEFADGEDEQITTVEFASAADFILPRIMRRLRDWLIDTESQEKADQILPQHDIDFLQEQSAMERAVDQGSAFAETKLSRLLNGLIDKAEGDRNSVVRRMARAAGIEVGTVQQILRGGIERPPEARLRGFARVLGTSLDTLKKALPAVELAEGDEPTKTKETEMGDESPEAKAAREALEKDKADFAESEKAHADRVTKFRADRAAASVDGLIDQGKVPPGHKPGLVAFMAALEDGDSLEFAETEGGEAKKVSPRAWFDSFLEALPKQIDFSERGGGDGGDVDSTDPDALANAAVAFQEEQRKKGNEISIDRAVRHVAKKGS